MINYHLYCTNNVYIIIVQEKFTKLKKQKINYYILSIINLCLCFI